MANPIVGADGRLVSHDGGNTWVANTTGLPSSFSGQNQQATAPPVQAPITPQSPGAGYTPIRPDQLPQYNNGDYNVRTVQTPMTSGGMSDPAYFAQQIARTTLTNASGNRVSVNSDQVSSSPYSSQGYTPERAPGIAQGNTQASGNGFSDLSNLPNLRLASGQVISNRDPNYTQYANIPGVTRIPVTPPSSASPTTSNPARPPQVTSTTGNIQTFADGSQLDTSTNQPIRPANPAQGNPSGETPQQTMDRIRQQQNALQLPGGQYISPMVTNGRTPWDSGTSQGGNTPGGSGTGAGMLPAGSFGEGTGTTDTSGTGYPAGGTDWMSQLQALQAAQTAAGQVSPEETAALAAQNAIIAQQANLAAGSASGIANLRDQPIAQTFVTGQTAAVERQTAARMGELEAQNTPLKTQLAALQAKRASASDVAKSNLDFAEKMAELDLQRSGQAIQRSAQNKPIEVGGSLVDPTTGKVIYQGAGAAKAPMTEKLGNDLYEKQADGSWKKVAAGTDTTSSSTTPSSYKEWQLAGSPGTYASFLDRNSTTNPDKPLSGEASKVLSIATTMIPEIEQLKTAFSKDYTGSLGGILSGTNRDLTKLVDNIADKVGRLRSGGAINKDEESRFKAQIGSISDLAFGNAAGALKALDGLIKEAQGVASGIRPSGAPSSVDSLDNALSKLGFKPESQTSLNGKVNVANAVESIGQYESGGNYKALGPVVANGDRAYGKYQMMGQYIPTWTKEVLGYSMTPAQFLKDPAAQDKVAQTRIGAAINKHGTLEDAASVWFTGQPVAKAGNRKDIIGTSAPTYVKNIMAIYNKKMA